MTFEHSRKILTQATVSAYNVEELRIFQYPKKQTTNYTTGNCYRRAIENSTKDVNQNTNNSSKVVNNMYNHSLAADDRNKPQKKPKADDNIFASNPRNFNQLTASVIRADCLKHGYKVEKTIGEGAYAKVKLAEVLPSKMARNPEMAEFADNDGILKVAIKVIDGKNVPKEFLKKFLPRELENHVPLPPSKHVVRVFEQFKANDRIYIVMEFCGKGDLLDKINQSISQNKKGLGEEKARRFFSMMVEGIHHIHTHCIVHRDLKCENILIDKEDNIKITDFGFSTQFLPGQSELLKTSCGSYAYTAPEVIKLKPYDGRKSDVWSLGIILFAMLNGRLPFNDAQLSELEEDMKMQRLRFEKAVSFESMVLIRRILQFNPSHRPSTADILQDPWLTGQHGIPRQSAKLKWTNSQSSSSAEVKDSSGKVITEPHHKSPVYFKSTGADRGTESTVTVNHERNETVVLKSRVNIKKNIWTRGPQLSHRPNTWPRSSRAAKEVAPKRGCSPCRGSSSFGPKITTVVVKQPEVKQKPRQADDPMAVQNIQLSKWYMEKYMAGKEVPDAEVADKNCACCQLESRIKNAKKAVEAADCTRKEVRVLDNGDVTESNEPNETTADENLDKNIPKADGYKSPPARPNSCARYTATTTRKPPPNSSTRAKSALRHKTTPAVSVGDSVKSLTPQPTTRAERVKYFKARLMLCNSDGTWKELGQKDLNGFPPLLVQTLNMSHRPSDITASTKPPPPPKEVHTPSPPTSPCERRSMASNWRRSRISSGPTTRVKPVQRVVVHNAAI